MKKIAAFTLLVFYLNASAQALLPFLVDCIAHILFWHDHLEHVHHGAEDHEHVSEEITHILSDDTQNAPTPTHPPIVLKPIAEHLNLLVNFSILKGYSLDAAIFSRFHSQLLRGYQSALSQPPEQA